MAPAITIRGVSKRFSLGNERYDSLKDRVIHLGRTTPHDFWALKDVEFDIEEGTTVGLLGHNGSGKSTLLKCMAGILQPTSGEITTRGRISALLELGAGFHPDLTGRENVQLNGLLLGLSRKEIARKFDTIIDFAGEQVEGHIDQQVKFYSSGMFVRLGFAIAVNIDPDILLVDEVLAVGDEAFQRKCLKKVKEFQDAGKTIVFVTHGADMVRQICDRAVVLDHGEMVCDDIPGVAIRSFREHLFATGRAHEAPAIDDELAEPAPDAVALVEDAPPPPGGTKEEPKKTIKITKVELDHPHRHERASIYPGEPLDIQLHYAASQDVQDVNFGIAVLDQEGRVLFGANTRLRGEYHDVSKGNGTFHWKVASVPLLDGSYQLQFGIQDRTEEIFYDWIESMAGLEVTQTENVVGYVALDVKTENHPSHDD
jgi:ABC-2 type transport system ATP-binding protein